MRLSFITQFKTEFLPPLTGGGLCFDTIVVYHFPDPEKRA